MNGGDGRPCDLHTHTTFSDGRLSPEEVLEIARGKGYGVGIADHCGRGHFQMGTNERFDQYLEALEKLPLFRSAELDLGNPGSVTPERLARCDYLIGGVHSLAMPGGEGGSRLDFFDPAAAGDPDVVLGLILEAIDKGAREQRFHILAHPGLLPVGLRPASSQLLDDDWDRGIIELALEHGFALEISSRWELPGRGLIEKARRAGVRFSLGSDGHGRDRLCRLDYSLALAGECGLGPNEIFRPLVLRRPDPGLIPTTAPTGCAR
ncbi:MAG TPA: hypothetical protein DDW31_08130 [candidate division Zixibacteria bacterium]|jgi:histidinol phosphatase-like PHP family hydrolase|nr:hypothetical protein [candidate division Zixibacteria bacterium]